MQALQELVKGQRADLPDFACYLASNNTNTANV